MRVSGYYLSELFFKTYFSISYRVFFALTIFLLITACNGDGEGSGSESSDNDNRVIDISPSAPTCKSTYGYGAEETGLRNAVDVCGTNTPPDLGGYTCAVPSGSGPISEYFDRFTMPMHCDGKTDLHRPAAAKRNSVFYSGEFPGSNVHAQMSSTSFGDTIIVSWTGVTQIENSDGTTSSKFVGHVSTFNFTEQEGFHKISDFAFDQCDVAMGDITSNQDGSVIAALCISEAGGTTDRVNGVYLYEWTGGEITENPLISKVSERGSNGSKARWKMSLNSNTSHYFMSMVSDTLNGHKQVANFSIPRTRSPIAWEHHRLVLLDSDDLFPVSLDRGDFPDPARAVFVKQGLNDDYLVRVFDKRSYGGDGPGEFSIVSGQEKAILDDKFSGISMLEDNVLISRLNLAHVNRRDFNNSNVPHPTGLEVLYDTSSDSWHLLARGGLTTSKPAVKWTTVKLEDDHGMNVSSHDVVAQWDGSHSNFVPGGLHNAISLGGGEGILMAVTGPFDIYKGLHEANDLKNKPTRIQLQEQQIGLRLLPSTKQEFLNDQSNFPWKWIPLNDVCPAQKGSIYPHTNWKSLTDIDKSVSMVQLHKWSKDEGRILLAYSPTRSNTWAEEFHVVEIDKEGRFKHQPVLLQKGGWGIDSYGSHMPGSGCVVFPSTSQIDYPATTPNNVDGYSDAGSWGIGSSEYLKNHHNRDYDQLSNYIKLTAVCPGDCQGGPNGCTSSTYSNAVLNEQCN